MIRRLWNRLRASIRRDEEDAIFREEIGEHLQLMTEERIARGMSAEEARREAILRLGGIAQLEEAHRDWRGLPVLENFAADIRYGWRDLFRNRRFALAAILTTGLAVGVSTAVFSLLDRALLRPLPYGASGRLMAIGIDAPLISQRQWLFAGTFQEWSKAPPPVVESLSAWRSPSACDWNPGTPERANCGAGDRHFLTTLEVSPALGRNFSAEEDMFGAESVALISFDLWRSHFGADPSVLGRQVLVEEVPTEIIGILPAGFEMPDGVRPSFLLPMRLREGAERQRIVHAIARIRKGVDPQTVREQFEPLFQRLIESVPPDFRKALAASFYTAEIRDFQSSNYRRGLLFLTAAVACFLLLACSNVASLLLARGESRRQEFAIRSAIGATGGRLARQALAESLLLGALSSGLGVVVAWFSLRSFRTFAPAASLRTEQLAMDYRVLASAIVLSLVVALLFGAAPALERMRFGRSGRSSDMPVRGQRVRAALVVLQVMLSGLLLTSSVLLTRSLWNLQSSPPGFDAEQVVVGSFILPAERYNDEERQVGFFRELEQRLTGLPGVTAAAITDSLPPGGEPRSVPYVALVGGGDASADGMQGLVKWRYVTPGYFRAMGIPIKRGRGFVETDRAASHPPVIISEGLAKRRFGDVDPVGQQLRPGERIVGIVGNVRNAGLESSPDPEFYLLRTNHVNATTRNQRPPHGWRAAVVVIRSEVQPETLTHMMRNAVWAIEPSVAIVSSTMRNQLDPHLDRPRLNAALIASFAAMALVLAGVGLYGLTSYLASKRTREIGIRMAVGASRADIIRLLIRSGTSLVALGLLAGVGCSIGAARLLQSFLFEVDPLDTASLCISTGLLAAVALTGLVVPAIRSTSGNLARRLREE